MSFKLRLEDDISRLLECMIKWEYPFPWNAEQLAASVALSAFDGEHTVGFIWLSPLELDKSVWSIHIMVSPNYRKMWFNWESYKKLNVMFEFLGIRTLIIETRNNSLRQIARVLGALRVNENISYIDLEKTNGKCTT